MPRLEPHHGKTHVVHFVESMREELGLYVRVLLAPGGASAAEDSTLASVRRPSVKLGSVELEPDTTAAEAERRILEQQGLVIEFLARDGTRPPLQTHLGTLGLRSEAEPSSRADVISITGQKRIASVQREFTEHHSHLGLILFSSSEHAKSLRGEFVHPIDSALTIASVREKKSTEELSIHGNMLVRTLEHRIREVYGLYAQVCIMTDQGKRAYTGEAHDAYTLSELNRRQQLKGRAAFSY